MIEWWQRSVTWLFDPDRLRALAAVLSALAALLWPLLLLVALLYFHGDLRRLVRRLRRGKFFGQELELADEIDQVQQAVTASAEQASAGSISIEVPAGSIDVQGHPTAESIRVADKVSAVLEGAVDAEIDEVLRVAAQSPAAGLMLLGTHFERRLRSLQRDFPSRSPPTVQLMLRMLANHNVIPRGIAESVAAFWRLRNHVVHTSDATREEILRAIDIGMNLLRLLAYFTGATPPESTR
jgi:hypothetical protein